MVAALALAATTASAERLRAKDGSIKDVPAESVEFALREGYVRMPKVMMRAPEGTVHDVDEDFVEEATRRGFWRMTDAEVAAYWSKHFDRIGEEAKAERKQADSEQRWRGLLTIAIGLAVVFGLVALLGRRMKKGD